MKYTAHKSAYSPHINLKDLELFQLTERAAATEKAATFALLEYLAEIDARKLYATKSYSSLFEYVVKDLKLSEPAAAERINAVRLMRAVPEVKAHLENGRMSLTNAAQIQRFLRVEAKVAMGKNRETDQGKPQEKVELVNACLNQSKREVEKILIAKQSEPARLLTQEKIKLITAERSEIRFAVEEKTLQKIKRVHELLGDQSLETIFDLALELLIMKEEKKRGMNEELFAGKATQRKIVEEPKSKHESTQPAEFKTSDSANFRYISIHLKRMIFKRSGGQCEYVNSKTKIRCQSKYRIQIDHIYPYALGGKTEMNNLRHLCRAHNQRAAIQWNLNPLKLAQNPADGMGRAK